MKSVGTRFLLPLGIIAVLSSVFVFYQIYESSRKHVDELLSQQAAMALEFNLAIRDYAAKKIRPAFVKIVGKDVFIPETMSTSFIMRHIFEEVKKKFPGYVIRFTADNPRNPINRATLEEHQMLEYFRQNPQVPRRTEEVQIEGRRYLAHFTPMWVEQQCMPCHGDPKDAPSELIRQYGPTAGFHRRVGDVAAIDTVAAPIEAVNASLASEIRSRSMVMAPVFALIFGSIFFIFRFVVAKRLAAMASHFDVIAAHTESPWMAPIEVKGNDEISVVGIAFNKLVGQLRDTHASLEQRVNERTEELRHANSQLQLELTERKRTEEALKKSQQKLRLLTSQLMSIEEKERRRIAWALHDELGQALTVLKIQLVAIEKKLTLNEHPLKANCEQMLSYIDTVIENVRRLSWDLSPSSLEDLGLSSALRSLVEETCCNHNLQGSIEICKIDHLFSPETQINIYRIFQESLTNVVKHAGASQVSVKISVENGQASFMIQDDGRGINMKQATLGKSAKRSLGLTTINERVLMAQGSLKIGSQRGKGTTIAFIIPTIKRPAPRAYSAPAGE